ncbi:hypothetical protein C8A05DRAFT_20042 [Staphylotrichum tortipilum]|uniref:Uncharacterized protein n=1 Tax=Staphylotrichum tortipilum TaxID=2831512 RepID=A0AAN6MBQ2_9PEZI|nr:hypothetical protein C8A05DRAFT_20042 [Staphylotrichum longicolle]
MRHSLRSITMASATSTSATGSILALPTPFIQPTTCTDIFSISVLTITVGEKDNHVTTSTAAFTLSDVSDPRFTSCQPPGWAGVVPESRFTFSPAVCPSGWTAYMLASESQLNMAYCCARYQSPTCILEVILTQLAGSPHSAYHISWQAPDTATLTPQPPAITCPQGISTWVPGSPITSRPSGFTGHLAINPTPSQPNSMSTKLLQIN